MLKLVDIDFKTFKKEIYPYYLELFQKDERKSLKQIEVPYLNGISKLISIKDNDKTVGFLIYNTLDGNKYVQLDYFAIFKEFQNKKYGTEAIKILKEFLKDYNGVYGEVEKAGLGQDEEENKKRDRRIKFWENLGFQLFDFSNSYKPPSARSNLSSAMPTLCTATANKSLMLFSSFGRVILLMVSHFNQSS